MAVAWCREEDVTLVSHLTPDKLWMVGELCLRWRGPVSLALWVNATEDLETRRSETTFLARRNGCRPFALTLAVDSGESYPVNRLRNMALAAVNTSHHLVSDMDFLPSNGLRTVARKRLMTFFDNKVAYVVPAFQKRGGNCQSVSSCRRRVEPLSLNIPKTFESLKDCLTTKDCIAFQSDNSPTSHSTTDLEVWLEQTDFREIPCFRSSRYEPYLIVNHKESPNYDERFQGYGKNKIQHVAHLRYLGFTFSVLPKHFLVHVPHPRSAAKKLWSQDFDIHHSVDHLYDTFLDELAMLHHLTPTVKLCGAKRTTSSSSFLRGGKHIGEDHRRRKLTGQQNSQGGFTPDSLTTPSSTTATVAVARIMTTSRMTPAEEKRHYAYDDLREDDQTARQ